MGTELKLGLEDTAIISIWAGLQRRQELRSLVRKDVFHEGFPYNAASRAVQRCAPAHFEGTPASSTYHHTWTLCLSSCPPVHMSCRANENARALHHSALVKDFMLHAAERQVTCIDGVMPSHEDYNLKAKLAAVKQGGETPPHAAISVEVQSRRLQDAVKEFCTKFPKVRTRTWTSI